MLRLRLVLLICFLSIGLVSVAQDSYRVSDIPAFLKEDANSTTITETYEVEIPNNKSIFYRHRRVITVYNKAGNVDAVAYASYDDDRRVNSIKATILDKNGEELEKFKKRDFEDVSAVDGGTLYSDSRLLVLNYTPTEYPYTLVFESETESRDTFYLPTWNMIDYYESSIWNTKFVVKYNPELGFRYRVFDPDGLLSINEGEGLLEVSATEVPATDAEELGPSPWEVIPNVRIGLTSFSLDGIVGNAKDWNELGLWQYRHLVSGLDAIPADITQQVNALVADAPTTKEKVKRIYNYMQDNTRYISVQLGIGGLRPYPADEVIGVGYGDCKGLTNLTMALLKTQGIDANYCVVWAGSHQRSIEKDFASLQGNHVILNVPLEDEELWLECTSQTIPFNFLGDFTDDRDVVALTPEGGIIKHTPVYKTEQNTMNTTAQLSLSSDGSISGTAVLETKGIQYDMRSSMLYKDQKDRISSYKEYWDYIDGMKIESIDLSEDKEAVSLKEEIAFSAPGYASFAGEKIIIPVNVLDRFTYIPRKYRERTQQALVRRGTTDTNEFIISLPEDLQIDSMPLPIVHESDFGNYKLTVLPMSENKVKVTRTFVLNQFRIEKEDYNELRNFMRSIARSDAAKMVLVKK